MYTTVCCTAILKMSTQLSHVHTYGERVKCRRIGVKWYSKNGMLGAATTEKKKTDWNACSVAFKRVRLETITALNNGYFCRDARIEWCNDDGGKLSVC